MDGYGLTVVVRDDDLEEAAGSVSADVEVAVAAIGHADGVAYRVLVSRSTTPCLRASSAISTGAGYAALVFRASDPAPDGLTARRSIGLREQHMSSRERKCGV